VATYRHTRTGWWLEEATGAHGPVDPTPALEGDARADVAVVGGGYLGLWTAWQLKELEPDADVVVLEADLCGHGPSGRNGGFVSTLWDDLPTLRERVGDSRAVETCRASEGAVEGIGTWCRENGIDAWYTAAPTLTVATSDAQIGDWDEIVAACEAVGAPEEAVAIGEEEVRRRCASPLFRGGGMLLRCAANVQPARLALGLRRRLLERGVRIHERTRVTRLGRDALVETSAGRLRARSAVLAVNAAAAGFAGHRLSLAVA
jgi:glycine/D-amino acid oxidase-like deaminating enzyme